MSDRDAVVVDPPMPLLAHVDELRRRLIAIVVILIAGSGFVYCWAGAFMQRLARPVGSLIFTMPLEAFDTRIKISFFGGFLLTLPLLLHQVWLFVGPAVSASWRRTILRLLPLSYVLFLCGGALCFFIVVPPATQFFLAFGSDSVRPLISIGAYLDFVVKMTLSFGLAFELPLVMYGLNRMHVISRAQFVEWRRPFYFLAFVAGAFMTSPEVFTQLCLALPMILLYELSLAAMPRDL